MSTPRTAAFYTLGCKLNFSETSMLSNRFEERGYHIVDFDDSADVYVINTCSVTDSADSKCRNIVRRSLRHNPDAKVVVVGCYAQLKPKEIAEIEGVDLVLGAAEKFKLLDYIDEISNAGKGWVQAGEIEEVNEFEHAFSFGDRTRSFLKVQDGCDYSCSFCTIPMARGQSRSASVQQAVIDAQALADLGTKEIVLTGVNIGDFGKGTSVLEGKRKKKEALFIDLVKALDEVEGIERFRISSIEPNLCSDEIIEFVAQSQRFVPHLHMPLQSGNNKQLRKMRRRYKRELYQDRVEKIKSLMPHACIGVDVIVGFPGETDEDFEESFRFIRDLPVSYLHVFTYSERPNTVAAEMEDVVPVPVRKERNKRLRNLSRKKKMQFYADHIGAVREVLLEEDKKDGFLSGFTDNYIRVRIPADGKHVNEIVEVKLEEITSKGKMKATLLETEIGV